MLYFGHFENMETACDKQTRGGRGRGGESHSLNPLAPQTLNSTPPKGPTALPNETRRLNEGTRVFGLRERDLPFRGGGRGPWGRGAGRGTPRGSSDWAGCRARWIPPYPARAPILGRCGTASPAKSEKRGQHRREGTHDHKNEILITGRSPARSPIRGPESSILYFIIVFSFCLFSLLR